MTILAYLIYVAFSNLHSVGGVHKGVWAGKRLALGSFDACSSCSSWFLEGVLNGNHSWCPPTCRSMPGTTECFHIVQASIMEETCDVSGKGICVAHLALEMQSRYGRFSSVRFPLTRGSDDDVRSIRQASCT